MYLNKENAEELFNKYSTADSNVISKESFLKLITEITDESNMLEHPHYVSIPEIRNKLGRAMMISEYIESHRLKKITDKQLIEHLHNKNKEFKESIFRICRREE